MSEVSMWRDDDASKMYCSVECGRLVVVMKFPCVHLLAFVFLLAFDFGFEVFLACIHLRSGISPCVWFSVEVFLVCIYLRSDFCWLLVFRLIAGV